MHQLAKVTQMISIMERSWIGTISVANRSKQVHQSQQHSHGFKGQTNLVRIVGGSIHKIRGIKQIITFGGGKVLDCFHRSQFSVVAALLPPTQQMVKRSHPFVGKASKVSGALSKSKPVGKRVLARAAVRHQMSSPLISAQEKTQFNVQGKENPGQASGDRLHFQSPSVLRKDTSKLPLW